MEGILDVQLNDGLLQVVELLTALAKRIHFPRRKSSSGSLVYWPLKLNTPLS